MLAILGLVALSSCVAPAFDQTHYHDLATIKVNAHDLISQCGSLKTAVIHQRLTLIAQIALADSQWRFNAKDVRASDTALLDMITRFEQANDDAHPNLTYCRDKLINIEDGADRAMSHYSALEND